MPTQLTNSELLPGTKGAPPLQYAAPGIRLPFALVGPNLDPGAVPYSVLAGSPILTYGPESRGASEQLLMLSKDVGQFACGAIGLFRPDIRIPFLLRYKRRYPGNPDLICSAISAEPFEPGRPADPFLVDVPALEAELHSAAFSRHMIVTVEYTGDDPEPDPDDFVFDMPETFTEIRITIGAEFLNVGHQDSAFADYGQGEGANVGHGFNVLQGNPGPIERFGFNNPEDAIFILFDPNGFVIANNDFDVPASFLVPSREFTIVWRHVFDPPWQTMAKTTGKINATVMPLFFNAPQETVLFIGASVTREPIRSPDGQVLYTVEYQFVEKSIRVFDNDDPPDDTNREQYILGWNHFWRPAGNKQENTNKPASGKNVIGSQGRFMRLILDRETGRGVYREADFSKLFIADQIVARFDHDPDNRENRNAEAAAERGGGVANTAPC